MTQGEEQAVEHADGTAPMPGTAGMTDGTPDAPARPRARVATMVMAGLTALLLAAGLVMGVFVKGQLDDRNRLQQARNQALAAGRQMIVNLNSISATTIDRDLARVLDGSTGTFREQFDRAKGDLKTLVVQRKTVSSGKIQSAGIVRADAESATLLIAADRTVGDATAAGGQTAYERWKVEMEKRGGTWLVAQLEPVA